MCKGKVKMFNSIKKQKHEQFFLNVVFMFNVLKDDGSVNININRQSLVLLQIYAVLHTHLYCIDLTNSTSVVA